LKIAGFHFYYFHSLITSIFSSIQRLMLSKYHTIYTWYQNNYQYFIQ
jgi:hypothetical protein